MEIYPHIMAYTILRTAKLKTMGEIGGSLAHTYRTRDTPNADPMRVTMNDHQYAQKSAALEAIQARLPVHRRKNAVLAIEYFIGASPEFFTNDQDGQEYFDRALAWLKAKHGAENVVWSIHRDETSPHLVAYVVPLDEKKGLNARKFLGGKAKLSAMQTEFAEYAGKPFGLERGVEGSKASHTTVKEYYASLSANQPQHWRIRPETVQPRVLKKGFLSKEVETAEQIAHRLTSAIQKLYSPAIKEAGTARLQTRRADEMRKTAESLREELKASRRARKELQDRLDQTEQVLSAYKAVFSDELTRKQQQELIALAQRTQDANKKRRETARLAEEQANEPVSEELENDDQDLRADDYDSPRP